MKTASSIVALMLATGLGACSHSENAQPQSAQGQTGYSSCATAQLPGVQASVADTNDGAAITFTAPENERDQLRQDVQAMSDANDNQGSAFAGCSCAFNQPGSAESMGGTQPYARNPSGASTSMQPAMTIPANSSVDDITTGAVLKLEAKDKAQVQALRDDTRQRVRLMRENGCLAKR